MPEMEKAGPLAVPEATIHPLLGERILSNGVFGADEKEASACALPFLRSRLLPCAASP